MRNVCVLDRVYSCEEIFEKVEKEEEEEEERREGRKEKKQKKFSMKVNKCVCKRHDAIERKHKAPKE